MTKRILTIVVELPHVNMDEESLQDWEDEVVSKINEVAHVVDVRRKDEQ